MLEIADRPDVFVSEELTAHFRGEPQAVHVLCYGITPEDHDWLQAHSGDVELCAAYMHEREIACALAHPYYTVAAPLHRAPPPAPGGAVRASGRSATAPAPASSTGPPRPTSPPATASASAAATTTPASTSGAPTPKRRARGTPAEFLEHMRAGRVRARGAQGSAAKWAHAAIALAGALLGRGPQDGDRGGPTRGA